jgi:hypothetical protein
VRKLWFAGAAVASGFILFAASPAQADGQPSGDAAARSGTESLHKLGGLLPVPGPADVPPLSGLPAGGMAVLAPATSALSDDFTDVPHRKPHKAHLKAQGKAAPSAMPTPAGPAAPARPVA